MLRIYISALCILCFAFASCNSAESRELTWTGCGITQKAFMDEIAEAYRQKTGINIRISGGGATKGIRAAAAGTSDLGGSCRDWLGGSKNKHPLEAKAELIQVAWDALVVIVHPENPVNDISLLNLKKLYDGQITSWKELGGQDNKIALVTRSEVDSGVGHMLRYLIFNDQYYEIKARSFTVKSTGPLEKKISRTATAIGIDGISSAKKSAVKILSLDGVNPTKENIASGRYPLFRPIYIAIHVNPAEESKGVIDFILSKEGQQIISEQGTVNLEEGKSLERLWQQKAKTFDY
jgi:phosphate transport system substrate-binding protein